MRTEISLEMAASPRAVFDLAADVSSWSRKLPHYRRSQVTGRFAGRVLVAFTALRPLGGPFGLPVGWRAICWSDDTDPDDLQLHFSHVRGITSGMRVTWHIRPSAGGDGSVDAANPSAGPNATVPNASIVTIEHEFERPILLIGTELIPHVVDRFFTHAIATRTLARFRELAERGEPVSGEPESGPKTNFLP
jgi:hypothetical protein